MEADNEESRTVIASACAKARAWSPARTLPAPVQSEHQIGLLGHLLAVDLDVGIVLLQRIATGRAPWPRSPSAAGWSRPGTAAGDRARLSHGTAIAAAAASQSSTSVGVHAEASGLGRPPAHRGRGVAQVLGRHQVGVGVVVDQGAVLVRAGDPVQMEPPVVCRGSRGTATISQSRRAGRVRGRARTRRRRSR